jgi:two-component system response regulator FlrC
LFYRLNVLPIRLPALRERRGDILALAKAALKRAAVVNKQTVRATALSMHAEQRLYEYGWPGNVRELNNVLQRAAILATSSILQVEDLQFESADEESSARQAAVSDVAPSSALNALAGDATAEPLSVGTAAIGSAIAGPALDENLKERERVLILEALRSAPSRKDAAAKLGISPRTLRHKLALMRAAGLETA